MRVVNNSKHGNCNFGFSTEIAVLSLILQWIRAFAQKSNRFPMMKRFWSFFFALLFLEGVPTFASADTAEIQAEEPDSVPEFSHELEDVVVTQRINSIRSRYSLDNRQVLTAGELKRAACCNLGESFTTNPSVDVSYSDAATGARQIKLLGLSGAYVQILTENIPNLRGAASPFGLSYIAGPWMQSIQISKGASSVKNGYESISGQINIEMLKPQTEDQELTVNAYADHLGKAEANAGMNYHLSQNLSTALLLHWEEAFKGHDENHDGFIDMPKVRQFSGMNRWAWMGENYVFQAAVKYLDEKRRSGQDFSHSRGTDSHNSAPLYKIDIDTKRGELFTKNAYIFDKENDGNVALILSGSIHDQNTDYGEKLFDVLQRNVYASLMFERKFSGYHQLSTGLSFNYDNYHQTMRAINDASLEPVKTKEIEAVSGIYGQYTFNYESKLMAMAGLRYDYSSAFGSMVTPRFHVRWNPTEVFSFTGSAGRGFRNAHVMAENNYLLASSRRIIIDNDLRQEDAWNMGAGVNADFQLFSKTLSLHGEYYYTTFRNQVVADMDSDPHAVHFKNLAGKSYSHAFQVEATYPLFKDFTMTLAYRYTDTKVDYGQGLVDKPLTSKSKGLLTAQYAPMMGLWMFDVTLAVNGGGRMPMPYETNTGKLSWNPTYKAFEQLSVQITRNFRHWALYIGGENLTGFRQKNPIVDASNPWGGNFDATMVYGPLHGAVVYIGFRYKLNIS